jgi:hypothetical protein
VSALESTVVRLKLAAETGLYDGLIATPTDRAYFHRCRGICPVGRLADSTMAVLIYTRDHGHHSSGWWKNPDYERCRHLSLSFYDIVTGLPRIPLDRKRGGELARMFFGDDTRWVWVEPPYTAEGKLKGVHHYRLFCDVAWQPIKPRGEVYTKDFTEKGWRSFSEIHGDIADPPMGYSP